MCWNELPPSSVYHSEPRKHVVIFVGDEQLTDRSHQSDALADDDLVYILQALSGG